MFLIHSGITLKVLGLSDFVSLNVYYSESDSSNSADLAIDKILHEIYLPILILKVFKVL